MDPSSAGINNLLSSPSVLELCHVNRTLRPIRSKLHSLSKLMLLPSSTGQPSNRRSGVVLRTYKRTTSKVPPPSFLTTPVKRQILSGSIKTPETPLNLHSSQVLASPLRRHAVYVRMFFKEALRKYWPIKQSKKWQGRIYSLTQLCCFAVGAQVELLEEFQDQEMLYMDLPGHLRRYVLMEHLRFVCSIHIQLPVLLNDLLEMAFEHEATFQCMELMKYAIVELKHLQSLVWYTHICRRLHTSSQLYAILFNAINEWSASDSNLLTYVQSLVHHGKAFEMAYQASMTLCRTLVEPSRIQQNALSSWVMVVVFRSLRLDMNMVMERRLLELMLALDPMDTTQSMQCILCFRILLSANAECRSWKQCISLVQQCESSIYLDKLFYAFASIDHLYHLCRKLWELDCGQQAYDIANILVQQFNSLKEQQKEAEVQCSFQDCIKLLERFNENEIFSLPKNVSYYFHEDFGEWVLGSPPIAPSSSMTAYDAPSSPVFKTPSRPVKHFMLPPSSLSPLVERVYSFSEIADNLLLSGPLEVPSSCAKSGHLSSSLIAEVEYESGSDVENIDELQLPLDFLDDRDCAVPAPNSPVDFYHAGKQAKRRRLVVDIDDGDEHRNFASPKSGFGLYSET